jgi:serine protease AprX
MAPEADVVLVPARRPDGRIGSEGITRALRWVLAHRAGLGIGIVSVSLGSAVPALQGNAVDAAVRDLVAAGVIVIVAAGNDGERCLVPPATAPDAVTVGGLDDRNVFGAAQRTVWHSNYGDSSGSLPKPELVAPSIWVTAPVLPGTDIAAEAERLFEGRRSGDDGVERRIAEAKLVTPYYQHVEGTSFAAPIVAGTAACMLEANPSLTPSLLRELLVRACLPVTGADPERQGAGAIDAGRAVAHALSVGTLGDGAVARSPLLDGSAVHFSLFHPRARDVRVAGSWNEWTLPGHAAHEVRPGLWHVTVPTLRRGAHRYKFTIDGELWLPDPANRRRESDGLGGWNSLLIVP